MKMTREDLVKIIKWHRESASSPEMEAQAIHAAMPEERELKKSDVKQCITRSMLEQYHNPLLKLEDIITENICSRFSRPESDRELVEAAKEWVQWFDYLSAYQHENLGKGLEDAEKNWGNMTQPSPPIDRLRKALLKHEEG